MNCAGARSSGIDHRTSSGTGDEIWSMRSRFASCVVVPSFTTQLPGLLMTYTQGAPSD